jgi:hypothetical protein
MGCSVVSQGGWLILSDLYYPGWEATCGGSRSVIAEETSQKQVNG